MKKVLYTLIIFLTFTFNSFTQNWITTGGNLQRNGISKITGPNNVTSALWSINSSTSSAWGNSVYTYGDKFVTSRIVLSPYTGKIELRNLNTGSLYAFKDNGSAFVQQWVHTPGYVVKGVGKDGSLYASNINDPSQFANSNIYRLDPANGNILDSAQTRTPLAYMSCGADSTIIVSTGESGNGRYVAFTPNLQTIKWQLNVPNNIYSGPNLGQNGIFVACGAGTEIKGYKTNYAIKPVADFKASKNLTVTTDTISFFDQSSYNATSWQWQFPGANTTSSTQQNPTGISYTIPGTYAVTLIASNSFGNDTLIRSCYITIEPWFGIQQTGNEIPEKFSLSQNYPNPFNPVTKIRFDLPLLRGVAEGRGVSLKVFDILGNEVETLVNEVLKPGHYEYEWNAEKYSSGIYFYTLTAKDFKETKKMLLIK